MSYLTKKLTQNEELIYTAKIHWIILFRPIILLCVLFFIITEIEVYGLYRFLPDELIGFRHYLYWLLIIVLAYPLLSALLTKITTKIGITNQRVLYKRGFIAINLQGMPLSKIENIDSRQTILGRIMSYGVVTIKGSGSTPIALYDISSPMKFRNQLAPLLNN